MKQRITEKQFDELSAKGFRKWELFWIERDVFFGIPTIGQMLEFLVAHNPKRLYILTNATLTVFKNKGWKWDAEKSSDEPNPDIKGYKEPIDALWQPTKEILEK